MKENGALVVVLGYGCHLDEPMKNYLNSVVSFVATNDVVAVIVTGGYTNRKSAPGISEAGMINSYLKESGVKTPIILDEISVTTNMNLRNISKIIRELDLTNQRVVIFSDEARGFKVKVLARLILNRWPEIKTYRLTRGVVAKLKQIFVAMPLNILALRFPFFERMELRRKERIMNNS